MKKPITFPAPTSKEESHSVKCLAERAAGARDPGQERSQQLDFYQEQVDSEEEIRRPRGYPRPVQFQLERKLSSALELLMRRLHGPLEGRTALVVCCGSGMETEFLARRGLRLVALDISLDAVRRARERAERYGLDYQLVVGDAEHLPFRDESFSLAFVHDGLHHLPDAYQGLREMMRVAREAAVVAEPADAAMTRLSVKLGISGKYEEAGNFVYRLQPRRVAGVFREAGAESWNMRRDVFYYQPWTFPIYRWLERGAGWWVFRAVFHVVNALLGRWGNSLKAVAIKREAWSGAD